MPRNLSTSEPVGNSSTGTPLPIPPSQNGTQERQKEQVKEIPENKKNKDTREALDHDEDPDPLPESEDAATHAPLAEDEASETPPPGFFEFKTSHIIVTSLFLGFLAGAAATLFFLHPGTPLHPLGSTPTLPGPQDGSVMGQLNHTIDQQKDLIQRLKEQARSRIGLPAQTVDPQNPARITYTPQDIAIAVQWISNCTSDITWLCNAPLEPNIITALNQKKAQNCPILVITGNQALRANLQTALNSHYSVYQSRLSLADATSLLIIDSKLVVDLSNSDFVWATAEPTVVRDIATYAINTLLKNSTHIKN
jgi:hypothetical protein